MRDPQSRTLFRALIGDTAGASNARARTSNKNGARTLTSVPRPRDRNPDQGQVGTNVRPNSRSPTRDCAKGGPLARHTRNPEADTNSSTRADVEAARGAVAGDMIQFHEKS
ncbi:MAG: hypothetical protein ACJ746_19685 [Bryobacteraceae bacterium]